MCGDSGRETEWGESIGRNDRAACAMDTIYSHLVADIRRQLQGIRTELDILVAAICHNVELHWFVLIIGELIERLALADADELAAASRPTDLCAFCALCVVPFLVSLHGRATICDRLMDAWIDGNCRFTCLRTGSVHCYECIDR